MSDPSPLPLNDAAPKSALDELTSGSAGTLVLLVLVFAGYAWSSQNGYVWDDDAYVTGNLTLRSFNGLSRIWTELGATPQYYPMTFTSFWLETQLFGLKPQVSHVVNALLHAGSVLLLWKILRRLSVPGAWAAAAVFAVHPIQVESVAWISERKNTLSLLLALSATWTYLRYARIGVDEVMAAPPGEERPTEGFGVALPDEPKRLYRLFLALFALALLAKTTVAVLPLILVVVIWWQRGRVTGADLLSLLPALLIGAAGGAVTSYVEHSPYYVGAAGLEWAVSVPQRVMLVGQTAAFYAYKILWPFPIGYSGEKGTAVWPWFPIGFNYYKWTLDTGSLLQWLPLAGLVSVLEGLWVLRRAIGRGPLAAALLFLIGLLPASGLFTFFPMRFSWVADHFAYVASIGLIVGVVSALAVALRRVPGVAAGVIGLVLAGLVAVTFWAALGFKDLPTLWQRTIAQNKRSWLAITSYGSYAVAQGDLDFARLARVGETDKAVAARDAARGTAEQYFRIALNINPNAYETYRSLGSLAVQRGKLDDALAYYRQSAAAAASVQAVGYRWPAFYVADILIAQGKTDEGLAMFDQLESQEKQLGPRAGSLFAQVHTRHGDTLRQSIKGPLKAEMPQADRDVLERVIDQYTAATEAGPDFIPAKLKLARVLIETDNPREALTLIADTLKLDPMNREAKLLTAQVAEKQGNYDYAAAQLSNLISLYPDDLASQIALGQVLKTMGRPADAVGMLRPTTQHFPDSEEAKRLLTDAEKAAATQPSGGR